MLDRLRNLFSTKSWTLSAPSAELLALFGGGGATASGETVSAETALRVPAVACAVRVIAESIAMLPVHVYERAADGTKQRATSHPAYALLHDDANAWSSAYDLKLQLMVDVLLHGNAVAWVNRVNGRVFEIIRMRPADVTIEDDGGAPRYFINDAPRGRRELPLEQVLHIRALSTCGVRGLSPVRQASEAIGLTIAQEKHAARIFGSGGRPSGVLSIPGKMSPEGVTRLAASWAASHAGANGGKTAILEQGVEFKPLTFNSVDLQFLELRKFQIDEVARIFRVPPHLLMEMGRATWGNSEEMGRQFVAYTLGPWIRQFEGALRRCIFTREERASYFAEFLLDDIQRADLAARADGYQKLIASRVLNPNEARAMENRPPYAGGDEFLNPNIAAAPAAASGGRP